MATPTLPSDAAPVGHTGAAIQIQERPALSVNGWWIVAAIVVGAAVAGLARVPALDVALLAIVGVSLTSFVVLQPGQTRVVQFFGRYVGTLRRTGLTCVIPFTVRRRVSVRV